MRPLLDQAAPPAGDDDGVFVQRLEDQAELPDEVVLRNEEWRRPARPGRDASLGAAGQLGSSITEMEQHVSGLQKNLDPLKKIQSALMGK